MPKKIGLDAGRCDDIFYDATTYDAEDSSRITPAMVAAELEMALDAWYIYGRR